MNFRFNRAVLLVQVLRRHLSRESFHSSSPVLTLVHCSCCATLTICARVFSKLIMHSTDHRTMINWISCPRGHLPCAGCDGASLSQRRTVSEKWMRLGCNLLTADSRQEAMAYGNNITRSSMECLLMVHMPGAHQLNKSLAVGQVIVGINITRPWLHEQPTLSLLSIMPYP